MAVMFASPPPQTITTQQRVVISPEAIPHLEKQLLEVRTRIERESEAKRRAKYAGRTISTLRYPDASRVPEESFSALSTIEQEKCITYHEQLQDGLKSLTFMPGAGEEMVLNLDPDTTASMHIVDQKAPFLTTVCVGLGTKISKRTIRKTYKPRIAKYLASLPAEGPLAHSVLDSSNFFEVAPWDTFFPPEDSHIGFYKGKDQTYLIASSHAGAQCVEHLSELLQADESTGEMMTVSQFTKHRFVQWYSVLPRRNLLRIIKSITVICEIEVRSMKDYNAFTPRFYPPVEMAIPDIVNHHNSYRHTLTKSVLAFKNCTDKMMTQGGYLVHGGHYHGYGLGKTPSPYYHEHFHTALPMHTGQCSEMIAKKETKRLAKILHSRSSSHKMQHFHSISTPSFSTIAPIFGFSGASSEHFEDRYTPICVFV